MLMKRKLTTLALAAMTLAGSNAFAAEHEKNETSAVNNELTPKVEEGGLKVRFGEKGGTLKVSGYLQAQWQWAQQDGIDA